MSNQIFFHADDFGRSKEISNKIIKCLKNIFNEFEIKKKTWKV